MKPYYSESGITIYHGDCREITAWLAGDICITDPPYGIAWSRGENKARASRSHAGIQNDSDTSARDEALDLWGDRPSAVFGSLYAPFPTSLKHICIWEKPGDAGVVGSTTGFRRDIEAIFLCGPWPMRKARFGSVLRSAATNVGNPWSVAGRTGHPHAKPTDLLAQLVVAGGQLGGGIVADPFAGVGSTLLAAKSMGASAIGIEIEERYCEIAAQRLSQEVLAL